MTLDAYWWDPRRSLRDLVGESVKHGRAWTYLIRRTSRMENFGDAVNPLILGELTGEKVRWAPLPAADVVGIGSVLNAYARRGGTGLVLGSGVREPAGLDPTRVRPAQVLGVRGLRTAAALGVDAALAVGDPGLVVPQVVARAARSRAPLFVPHFTMPATPEGRRLVSAFRAAGYSVRLPAEPAAQLAAAVSAAAFVVSTSLHALVFADAYGVPCARLSVPWLAEPDFKYDDYRSVFGVGLSTVPVRDALAKRVRTAAIDHEHAVVSAGVDDVVRGIYDASRRLGAPV